MNDPRAPNPPNDPFQPGLRPGRGIGRGFAGDGGEGGPGGGGLFPTDGRDTIRAGTVSRPTWLWLLVLTLAGLAAWIQHLPPPPAPTPPTGPQASVAPHSSGDFMRPMAKMFVAGAHYVEDPAIKSQLAGFVEDQLAPIAATPRDQLRLAIVYDAVGDTTKALAELDKIKLDQADEDTKADIETATTMLQGNGASPDAAKALQDRQGWYGQLVATRDLAKTDPVREPVVTAGLPLLIIIFAGGLLFAFMFLAGIVLWVVALALGASGRLRPYSPQPLLHGPIGLEMVTLFFLAFILMQVIAAPLASVLSGSLGLPAEAVVLMLQWSLVALLAWPLLRGVPGAEARRALGLHSGRGFFRELGVGVLGYMAGLPMLAIGAVISLIATFIYHQITNPGNTPDPNAFAQHPIIDKAASAGPLFLLMIATLAVVWAPLVEETIFRGALYPELRRKLGWIAGAAITGLIFAIVHPIPWLMLTPWVMLGLHFSLLRHWRGSLIAPMTAHFLQNAGAITMITLFFKLG